MSKGSCDKMRACGTLSRPEETESGSAGTQPDKGYSGLRCAKGRLRSLAAPVARYRFLEPIGHRSHALKNPTANLRVANDLRKRYALSG